MTGEITIVDRGRGQQLSTCRITVLDLVPYFQKGCGYEEIIRWIPTLSQAEIAVVERFYLDHQEDLTRRIAGPGKGAKSKFACTAWPTIRQFFKQTPPRPFRATDLPGPDRNAWQRRPNCYIVETAAPRAAAVRCVKRI